MQKNKTRFFRVGAKHSTDTHLKYLLTLLKRMLCPYFFAPLRLCEMKKIYELIGIGTP